MGQLAGDARRCGQTTTGASRQSVPLWKRVLDVSLIVLAAPAWVPVMIVVGVAIKLLSRGPVLFRQERVGLGGECFLCLKFRTMQVDANTSTHEKHLAELMKSSRPMTKLDADDNRLIPCAWVLRSTGLDELPQLINVLRGEMSLIGPRPCTPKEYSHYTSAQKARFGTLPGLTGLWQVSGKNHTTFSEMIALDIRYAETLSLRQDVGILLRTPVAVSAQVADTILQRKLRRPASADQTSVAGETHAPQT